MNFLNISLIYKKNSQFQRKNNDILKYNMITIDGSKINYYSKHYYLFFAMNTCSLGLQAHSKNSKI